MNMKTRFKEPCILPAKGMDPECVELCNAINQLPGIRTIESCCGHGKDEYRIFFWIRSTKALKQLLYLSRRHSKPVEGRWRVECYTTVAMDHVTYILTGPTGEPAYRDAKILADDIRSAAEYVKKGQVMILV